MSAAAHTITGPAQWIAERLVDYVERRQLVSRATSTTKRPASKTGPPDRGRGARPAVVRASDRHNRSRKERCARQGRISARRPLLDRHRAGRTRSGGRLLPRTLRLGVRGPHAVRRFRQLLRRPARTTETSPPSDRSRTARTRRPCGAPTSRSMTPTSPLQLHTCGEHPCHPVRRARRGPHGDFSDPSGADFSVWQAKQHKGAQLVNEPGTWNFSDLNARDVDGAKAFYGAVFGWVQSPWKAQAPRSPCCVCRATATSSSSVIPSRPVWRDEIGAPAWLRGRRRRAGTDAQRSVPRRRRAPLERHVRSRRHGRDRHAAAELGGTVIARPFDAGPTRIAVVSDPQGAVFTVSKFDPQRL